MASNPLPEPVSIASASVLVVNNDRVLLVLRGRAPNRGLWALPGGRVEPGESPEAAALRELAEETGIIVDGLRRIDTVDVPPSAEGEPRVTIAVFTGAWRAGTPRSGDDAAEARWIGLADVGRMALTEGTRAMIERHGKAAHAA
jgi:ADP-ribose pyrophosphatase YjhB (NUDIX family)